MTEMGVTFGQGYLYQKPQPLETVLAWLGQVEAPSLVPDVPSVVPEAAE
jgi:EAL domain-containing protein (putative c-di-GMP-specific phosphodiesterase class I)